MRRSLSTFSSSFTQAFHFTMCPSLCLKNCSAGIFCLSENPTLGTEVVPDFLKRFLERFLRL